MSRLVFPMGGALPRHPSQLFEAALEGLMLLAVTAFLARRPSVRARPGLLFGTFLALYGLARLTVEFFRAPDPFLGFVWQGASMRRLPRLPMIGLGMGIVA